MESLARTLRPIEMGESTPSFSGAAPDKTFLYKVLGVENLGELHRLDGSYRDLLVKVASEQRVPVADAASAFAERHELLFGPYDLVHCNPAGSWVIADTLRQKLLELGWFVPAGP